MLFDALRTRRRRMTSICFMTCIIASRRFKPPRLGKSLEPFHLFWMEDATTGELQEGFRVIRQHTTTPLAVGEVFDTVWDARLLITEQLIDYLRMSLRAGGITALRKVASFADLYHVQMGCHGATDLSPITMGAALHFDRPSRMLRFRSTCRTPRRRSRCFLTAIDSPMATCTRRTRPATAWTSTSGSRATYPYERAYLPVNRKIDGTLWDW